MYNADDAILCNLSLKDACKIWLDVHELGKSFSAYVEYKMM